MNENRKRAARGVSTGLGIIFFMSIILLINYLSVRHHYRYDATANKMHSLSDQTKKILKDIKKPVEIAAFFEDSNEQLPDIKSLLKEYTYYSSQVSFRVIDPITRPDLAEKYGVSREGTTVLESAGQREETMGTGEVDITSALLKLIRVKGSRVVYCTEGHEEYDPGSFDERSGMNKFTEAMEKENYAVKKISLASRDSLPEDCAALMIAGPKIPFLPEEMAIVKRYTDEGGRLLIMLDPPSEENPRIPSFESFFAAYDLRLDDDFVLDNKSYVFPSIGVPIIQSFGWHQITKDFRLGIVLAGARSINVTVPSPENVTVEKLGETTENSWGEVDLSLQNVDFNEGKDLPGPLIVAVAIEKKIENPAESTANSETTAATPITPSDASTTNGSASASSSSSSSSDEEKSSEARPTRIVLVGDADMLSNANLELLGNRDFLLNSVNWLCQDEELMGIRSKTPEFQRLVLTNQDWLTISLSVLFMPLLFLALGIFIWWKRR